MVELSDQDGFPALPDAEIALIRGARNLSVAAERLSNFVLACLNSVAH
jgi:hypothetical protein